MEYTFIVWTQEAIDKSVGELRKSTPVELSRKVTPDVAAYILELRGKVDLWKEMYHAKA